MIDQVDRPVAIAWSQDVAGVEIAMDFGDAMWIMSSLRVAIDKAAVDESNSIFSSLV
jgi:hypothetical protein